MSLTDEVKMFMYNKEADLVGICRAEKMAAAPSGRCSYAVIV